MNEIEVTNMQYALTFFLSFFFFKFDNQTDQQKKKKKTKNKKQRYQTEIRELESSLATQANEAKIWRQKYYTLENSLVKETNGELGTKLQDALMELASKDQMLKENRKYMMILDQERQKVSQELSNKQKLIDKMTSELAHC